MKRLLQTCAEEVLATTLAVAMTITIFAGGWYAHDLHCQATDCQALRGAQYRALQAQARYYERLAEISTVTIAGPESYTPAEPAAEEGEPTPAKPKTGEDPKR